MYLLITEVQRGQVRVLMNDSECKKDTVTVLYPCYSGEFLNRFAWVFSKAEGEQLESDETFLESFFVSCHRGPKVAEVS